MIFTEEKLNGSFVIDKEVNRKVLYSLEGFAQRFFMISDNTEITYFSNEFFVSGMDWGVRYNDQLIGVELTIEPVAFR